MVKAGNNIKGLVAKAPASASIWNTEQSGWISVQHKTLINRNEGI